MHGRMESPNTSSQAVELNQATGTCGFSCLVCLDKIGCDVICIDKWLDRVVIRAYSLENNDLTVLTLDLTVLTFSLLRAKICN